jgi:hypothetical protein
MLNLRNRKGKQPARAGKLFDFPIVKALHDAEQDLGRKQFRIVQAIGFNCIVIFLEDRVVMLGDTNKQALWSFYRRGSLHGVDDWLPWR